MNKKDEQELMAYSTKHGTRPEARGEEEERVAYSLWHQQETYLVKTRSLFGRDLREKRNWLNVSSIRIAHVVPISPAAPRFHERRDTMTSDIHAN